MGLGTRRKKTAPGAGAVGDDFKSSELPLTEIHGDFPVKKPC